MMEHRIEFQKQLRGLSLMVVAISKLANESISDAFQAVSTGDEKLANQVIKSDEVIDELEWKIENDAAKMIAREQPNSSDLRRILAAITIASQIERIADHAKHLSRGLKRLSRPAIEKYFPKIIRLGERGLEMLTDAINAMESQDPGFAKGIAKRDEEIDLLHSELQRELLEAMRADKDLIQDGTTLLFLNRFMERLGDHVTNICETIYFAETGEHIELNN
jgi:phosphate transport system protein